MNGNETKTGGIGAAGEEAKELIKYDFLAFEDFAYARHAAKAGVNLKTIIYRRLGHGFADQIGVMPQAEDLMSEIAAMMREVL